MVTNRTLWGQHYRQPFSTAAGIEQILDLCDGKFNRLLIQTRSDKDPAVYFEANHCAKRPERIDGLMPGAYAIQRAAERGIDVGLWVIVGYIGTYYGLDDPPTDPRWNLANLNLGSTVGWVNYALPEVRTMIVEHVMDLVDSNPGIAEVNLDYLRLHRDYGTYAEVTFEHINDVARQIRARLDALPPQGGIEGGRIRFTAAIGRSKSACDLVRRDVSTWCSIFDNLYMMSYDARPGDEGQQGCLDYLNSLPRPDKIWPGIGGHDKDRYTPSDGYQLAAINAEWWRAHGHEDNLHFFCSHVLDRAMADLFPDLEPSPDPPDREEIEAIAARMAVRADVLRATSADFVAQADVLNEQAAQIESDIELLETMP